MSNVQSQVDAVFNSLIEAYESGDLYEWIDDVLDVKYMVDGDLNYVGVRLMVTFGGPTIYVDTFCRQIQGYWWGDEATREIYSEVADELDEVWEEFFNCVRDR